MTLLYGPGGGPGSLAPGAPPGETLCSNVILNDHKRLIIFLWYHYDVEIMTWIHEFMIIMTIPYGLGGGQGACAPGTPQGENLGSIFWPMIIGNKT